MGTILEPSVVQPYADGDTSTPLYKENYLSEFETEDEKSVVRANLGVYAQEAVYTMDEAELMVNEKIHSALEGYVSQDELPKALEELSQQIADESYVKSDGSVPFTNPQSQSSVPTKDEHLANKLYVDNSLTAHVNAVDPHGTIDQVEVMLASYAKLSDVYTQSQLYTQKEIDSKISDYVKRDGSTSFTNPQIGVDPSLPSHLSTMRYVNLVMQNHKCEEDPHDFIATLKRYLSNYYTKSETYTKAQTYSRLQLYDIIKGQMNDVVDQAIATYLANNGSVTDLKDWIVNELTKYIKADGSVAHTATQVGVAAVNSNEFVVLEQLSNAISELNDTLSQQISTATNQSTWVTSGPVRTTVGFVEDNSTVPSEMTVQQVCDAVFYGRRIGVCAPDYAEYGDNVCIKIYAHGIGTLEEVDIYKNGDLIGTLSPSDFICSDEEGCYYEYCDTGEFTEDVEWTVEFHYPDDKVVTDTATTKLSYPIFIGMVPYWWNAQEDITMDSLRKLAENDPDNNAFYTMYGPDISSLSASFDFADSRKRSLVVVLPYDYPDLLRIVTPTQEVEVDAFAKWVQPMYPNNVETGVLYKIYVFEQPLVQLTQVIEFVFGETASDEPD